MIKKPLTNAEVQLSREKYGENLLSEPERDPWWKLFFEKFDDPIIRILLIADAISLIISVFVTGEYIETFSIFAAILLATFMQFWNEYKAGKQFDILNKTNDSIQYEVLREEGYISVPKKDIVVGDLVILSTGEEIPADGVVVEAISMQVDESSLTGESKYITKKAVVTETAETDVFSEYSVMRGSYVVYGHGMMRVQAVGNATEIGKTAHEAGIEVDDKTPLNKQLLKLSKLIGVVAFSVAGLMFFCLFLKDKITGSIAMTSVQWAFMFVLIAGVMTALMKVWLPVVYDAKDLIRGYDVVRPKIIDGSLPLGISVLHDIIRIMIVMGVTAVIAFAVVGFEEAVKEPFLPSGAVFASILQYFMLAVALIVVAVPEGLPLAVTLSLAYSMKKMMTSHNLVRKMHACETIGAVTVICTDKTGTLTENKMKVYETHFLPEIPKDTIYKALAINTTANLGQDSEGKPMGLGNPTETALLFWLKDQNIPYTSLRDDFIIKEQEPFSTETKMMRTVGESGTVYIKGAPEIVMSMCGMTEADIHPVLERIADFQKRGMRALGFAYGTAGEQPEWMGFVVIEDPIREEVRQAIADSRSAGIKVKIITGDNQETAAEIAAQIGLLERDSDNNAELITGQEFERQGDKADVSSIMVMSRARPANKKELVRMLKEKGEVVAVTGDGTNDAPALNYADVGLAMGIAGTSVAKEAADIILLDDNFQSIVNAVMWGRSLYRNIQRFILFQLSVNVVALIINLIGPFIGVGLPFTVVQMLWVNLIMDTFAALALASEPPNRDVMKDKPRDPETFIVTQEMWKQIFSISGVFTVVLLAMLAIFRSNNVVIDGPTYEGTVLFTVFVLMQFWNMFNAKIFSMKNIRVSTFFNNKSFLIIATAIFLGQVLMTQLGGEAFRTIPLGTFDWVKIAGATSLIFFINLVWKIKRGSSN